MFRRIKADSLRKMSVVYKVNLLSFIVLLLISIGCNKSIRNESDYLKWLDNPSNGLVRTKHVSGFDIKVKFMPPSYLFCHDMSANDLSISQKQKDSLYQIYKHSLTFMMTLGPDKGDSNKMSVMYYGVKAYTDYVKRDLIMNFDFKKYAHIEVAGKEYDPVLSTMENSYELGLSRNVFFVFVPKDTADRTLFISPTIDFTYDDDLFQLGLNHFVFKQEDIQGSPLYPGITMN